MISYRLTNCEDCNTIPVLLQNIDCKITELAKKQYGNIVFILNNKINSSLFSDLLHYKRILQFKSCNSSYANNYDIDCIANRVKILINK